ncbi:MAG: hypothetical protein WC736_14760 [Gallionella sp.]
MKDRAEFERVFHRSLSAALEGGPRSDGRMRHIARLEAWVAAKESSSKELEASRQMIAELEAQSARRLVGLCKCSEEKEALEKKLAEQQALIVDLLPNYGDIGTRDTDVARLRATTGTEELTQLLTAARQQGFDEGKQDGRDESNESKSVPCTYCEGTGTVDAGIYKTAHTHYSICRICKGSGILPPQTKG